MQLSFHRLLTWADKPLQKRLFLIRIIHILVRVVCISGKEFGKNELSIRSAALTYTVMLSLVPMLAMGTALVKGLGGGDQLREVIYEYVKAIEPADSTNSPVTVETETTSEDTSSFRLSDTVDNLFAYVDRTNFAALGTFGVLGIVVSIVLVFGNIEMAMNRIWKVKNGRSIMRKVSDYLAIMFLLPFSLNIGLASATVLRSEVLLKKISILLPFVWLQAIFLKLLPVFFLALTLYVIYLFFPNTRVKTIPAAIGAIFAGFFWFETQNLYLSLQLGVAKYNAIYGSFATLPLFLIWMYIGWIFILAGAQLAFACQNRKTYTLIPPKPEPSLQLAIGFDFMDFILENFANNTNTTLDDFKETYPDYVPGIIDTTVERLIEAGLIHYSGATASIKPSLPAEELGNERLVTSVLGNTYGETKGGILSRNILEQGVQVAQTDASIQGDK